MSFEVFTVAQMYTADRFAIETGISGAALMEAAGAAVADVVRQRFAGASVLALCGPGSNGGDGFVAARRLQQAGFDVRVALLGDRSALKADAARAAQTWTGPVVRAEPWTLGDSRVVIDALFGAGLTRPIDGAAAHVVEAVNRSGRPVVSVDVPSGVYGDGSPPDGVAVHAGVTVTFHRKKPAHLLEPSASLCGEVRVAPIGIPDEASGAVGARIWENHPTLWLKTLPTPGRATHKHARGRLLVWSPGPDGSASATLGAARLAARAGSRIGAGWTTIACDPSALAMLAQEPLATLVRPVDLQGFVALAADHDAVVIGPGLAIGPAGELLTAAALGAGRPLVLDAGALAQLALHTDPVWRAPADLAAVLTPHAGEFARLWPDIARSGWSRLDQARAAAERCRAVVVLKGADTVVAGPDGRAVINVHASPWLATAGTGDVLAGMIGGLMAQGMMPFEAACAGVWLHGDAGLRVGPGLIADDLAPALPATLSALLS